MAASTSSLIELFSWWKHPSLVTGTFDQKAQRWGVEKLVIIRGNSERSHSHFIPLIPKPTSPGNRRIDHWFRIYSISWETLFHSHKVLLLNWHHNWVFERPLFYQASCFKVMGDITRSVNFMSNFVSMSPLPYLICCKINSLVRSNAMWSAVMVNTINFAFGFGRSLAGREGKSLSRISVYPTESKALSLPCWKWSYVRSTHHQMLVDLMGIDTLSGAQCWSVLLTVTYAAVALARLALMSRSPCCWVHAWTPIPSLWPLSSWPKTEAARERGWLRFTEQIILSTDYSDSPLLRLFLSGHLPGTQISLYSVPIQRVLYIYLFPRPPGHQSHQISGHVLSKSSQIISH